MSETITAEEILSANKLSATPPALITRNEHGLVNDGSIKYVYTPEGLVDWRKMIKPQFLAPNKQNFEKRGKAVPTSIEGLDDRDLVILLAGIKDLAQIRGYREVKHNIISPAADYIASSCSIEWIPNFETEGRTVIFSAIGDASPFNTNSFGKNYLGPIAENRAFVRAVRNFLKINIVSQEEIGAAGGAGAEADPTDVSGDLLAQTMATNGVTFEKLKSKLIEEKFEGADDLKSVFDIPKFKQFELIERIKKKAAAKTKV